MKKINMDRLIELMEKNVELLEDNVRASERINDRLDEICGDMGSDEDRLKEIKENAHVDNLYLWEDGREVLYKTTVKVDKDDYDWLVGKAKDGIDNE